MENARDQEPDALYYPQGPAHPAHRPHRGRRSAAYPKDREFFALARPEGRLPAPKSISGLLTSMSSRMRFNAEIARWTREFAKANTPTMLKSAVVGTTAAMKAILATLRFLTGREHPRL